MLGAILVEAIIVLPLATTIPDPGELILTGIISVIVIGLTVFDATTNDAKNSAKLTVASDECAYIHSDWKSLWIDIETNAVKEKAVRKRQRELLTRINTVAARLELNVDEKRNTRNWKDALRVMKGRHAK